MSEEEKKPKKSYGAEFKEKYRNRASIVKEAKIQVEQKEFAQAAYKYQEYLSIIARYHDIPVIDLTPAYFDPKKEVAEMLMISQVCWELLKIYERIPNLKSQFEHCIDLFVRFTLNQPYQRLNYELLRRYVRKSKVENKEPLRKALNKIKTKSRGCFVATYAFGDQHQVTERLRIFKKDLAQYSLGLKFIDFYYQYSHLLIKAFKSSFLLRILLLPILKSALWLISLCYQEDNS